VAQGYNGANRKVKLMTAKDQINGKKSINAPGIAHNLEAHDADIIEYICDSLFKENNEDNILVREDRDGNVGLVGVKSAASTSITLPSSYNNIAITKIHRVSFSEAMHVNLEDDEIPIQQVTSITIPASVTEIDDWAFNGLTNLQTVIFEDGSQLQRIGIGAFYGCTSLQNIILPDGVEVIDNYAFMNCSALTSFTIPASVTNIGVGVFFGCSTLNNISVAT
jgi:hypothetical protein